MKKIYLYGSGRDAVTRFQRRASNTRRMVRLGNIIVRPGKHVAVLASWLGQYADEVMRLVDGGAMLVRLTPGGLSLSRAAVAELLGAPADAVDTVEEDKPAEPVKEAEPVKDEPEAEPEPEEDLELAELPADWRKLVKKDLLKLMNERGIEVPEDTKNDNLIESIEAWAIDNGLEA